MTPRWALLIDGVDRTARFADLVQSLRLVDAPGTESDAIDLVLYHPDAALPVPSYGQQIEVRLWYDEQPDQVRRQVGKVNELAIAGWPITVSVRATGVDYSSQMKERRTQSWDGVTLGDMVRSIAARYDLQPRVDEWLAAVDVPHLDQQNESDMALLTRLGAQYDAQAVQRGGYLVLAQRGTGTAQTLSGASRPAITITPANLAPASHAGPLNFAWQSGGQPQWAAVEVQWHDTATAQTRTVHTSDATPVRRLTYQAATEAEAIEHARAELARIQRATAEVRLSIYGDPRIASETPIDLTGFHPSVDGRWVTARVEHLLGSDYTTTLTATPPSGRRG
ncbi:MAG: hypothetical protein H6981_04410 [Gammaproteobacteria bacterium]|nr:hypothetical protein [Gammaproteobacteria bacterium]